MLQATRLLLAEKRHLEFRTDPLDSPPFHETKNADQPIGVAFDW